MPRRRFFIPSDHIRDGKAVLTPDQSHHLRDVLRLRVGDEIELFDGEGRRYSGRIECQGTETRIGSLLRIETLEIRKTPLVLAAALIKPDRFEWILQKGTELGVDEFIPLETRYSTVHISPAKLTNRLERWQRIVMEASKQSRRLIVPKIQPPLPFPNLLAMPESGTDIRFMLHEKAPARLALSSATVNHVLLCAGPEGGWDCSEIQMAERAGFKVVNIGSRILRAETACVSAIAVLQFLLEGS